MGTGLPLRILYVVPYTPNRVRTRPFHLIRHLADAGHSVTLATVWTSPDEWDALRMFRDRLERVVAERVSPARSLWNCCAAMGTGAPLQASYSWSPELAARIRQLLDEHTFDVIHVEHLRGARYGLAVQGKGVPVVWDSVDCISDLFRLAARRSRTLRSRFITQFELPRTEHYEGWLASQFRRVVVTSERDRQELAKLAPATCGPIDVLTNGVDLEYFTPTAQPRDPATLVITGKMSYHANVTAVTQFAREAMPAVWKQYASAKLMVVGKDPSPEIRRLGQDDNRIQVTGTVADVRPYLAQATVAVAPIVYGVGVQNKVLEALACGTPLVATPEAVGAIGIESGRQALIRPTQEALAQGICELLGNPTQRDAMGREGRKFVERNHSWVHLAQELSDLYRAARN